MSVSTRPTSGVRGDGAPEQAPVRGDGLGHHRVDRRTRHAGTRRAIIAVKAQHARDRTVVEHLADWLTRVASTTPFLVLHVIWFAGWIAWNTGHAGRAGHLRFDPYPFGLLTMIVSLEAIFLSIFVLMSQARESAIAELREEVTLAVNLRMEEEVTKMLQLVAGLYTRLGHPLSDDPDLRDMLRPLDAEGIERDLIEQIKACSTTTWFAKEGGSGANGHVGV
jgi:uncharacterized membrane protein